MRGEQAVEKQPACGAWMSNIAASGQTMAGLFQQPVRIAYLTKQTYPLHHEHTSRKNYRSCLVATE